MATKTHLAAKAQDSSKLKKIIIGAAIILTIVLVIGLNVYNIIEDSGILQRKVVAVESENYSLSVADMQYYYGMQYQNFVNTWTSYGMDVSSYIDSTKSLKLQDCTFSSGQSWFEYFMTGAKSYATELLSLCEAARSEGLALTEDDYATVEENMKSLDDAAEKAGYSTKRYVSVMYGAGVTRDTIETSMEMELLASKYTGKYVDAADVSDETLEATYKKDPLAYDTVDYIAFTFDYNDLLDDADAEKEGEDKDEDEEKLTKEEAVAIAEKAAEKAANAKSVESFNKIIKNYLVDHLGYTEEKAAEEIEKGTYALEDVTYDEDDAVAVWAFKADKGDVTNIVEKEAHNHSENEAEDAHDKLEDVYTVALLTRERGRDESVSSRDVRHILFTNDTYADDSKVKEVYEKWVADGAKVADFEALAAEYSEDPGSAENGGLYEGVTEGEMVEEFNDWLFDEKRVAGDHAIVETKDYGWHIMYYGGGMEGWKSQITNEIREEAYAVAFDAAIDAHNVTVYSEALDKVDG